jgi:hypothetical protein
MLIDLDWIGPCRSDDSVSPAEKDELGGSIV